RPVRALRLPWYASPWRAGRGQYVTVAVLLLFLTTLAVLLPRSGSSTPEPPKDDAQQAEGVLAELQRDLAAGKKVALQGIDGRPRWHCFLTEKRRLPPAGKPGDAFRLEAWSVTLMELLP